MESGHFGTVRIGQHLNGGNCKTNSLSVTIHMGIFLVKCYICQFPKKGRYNCWSVNIALAHIPLFQNVCYKIWNFKFNQILLLTNNWTIELLICSTFLSVYYLQSSVFNKIHYINRHKINGQVLKFQIVRPLKWFGIIFNAADLWIAFHIFSKPHKKSPVDSLVLLISNDADEKNRFQTKSFSQFSNKWKAEHTHILWEKYHLYFEWK